MLSLLTGKKEKRVEKINLDAMVVTMANRRWDVERVEGKSDVVVVLGKYRNRRRDFHKLFIHFLENGKIAFKDEFGRLITHIPAVLERSQLFPQLKNVMNVL